MAAEKASNRRAEADPVVIGDKLFRPSSCQMPTPGILLRKYVLCAILNWVNPPVGKPTVVCRISSLVYTTCKHCTVQRDRHELCDASIDCIDAELIICQRTYRNSKLQANKKSSQIKQ